MTKPAAALMVYLARLLKERPGARRRLEELYAQTTGKPLIRSQLWRHTSREFEPTLSTSLIYLIFLHESGELIPATKRGQLFTYKHPEWLKSPAKK